MSYRRWHGQFEAAEELVKRYHYSHRLGSIAVYVATAHDSGGLFDDFGPARAALVFTNSPARWRGSLLELSRMVRARDAELRLSELVAWALRQLRRQGHGLVISFADATLGHHGGIYQACGWHYHGRRERTMDGLTINGKFFAGRQCNEIWGTRSPQRLRDLRPEWTIEPHWDEGKHLYWRALNSQGNELARQLGFVSTRYPKRQRAESIVVDAPTDQVGEGGSEPASALHSLSSVSGPAQTGPRESQT